MSQKQVKNGGKVIVALVVVLLILHQDNWFWESDTLLMGFLPIGLFWHACISIGATCTWFLATKIAWPFEGDDEAGRLEPAASEEVQS